MLMASYLDDGVSKASEGRSALRLRDEVTVERQVVDPRAEEAADRILGGADDRLALDVERGIQDDGDAGFLTEPGQQLPVARVDLPTDDVDAGRPVDVHDGRDL